MVTLRERGVMQRKLARAEALVQSSRIYLHAKLTECWDKILAGEIITLEEKADLLLAATHTNQCCLEAVELVYTAAGTNGIYMKNKRGHGKRLAELQTGQRVTKALLNRISLEVEP
jgi:hypothetical protein